MKIYLSGPMLGYPDNNYPLFNRVADQFRQQGDEVFNPAEFPFAERGVRAAFSAYCKFICEEADAIVMLPGHDASVGARCERSLAENCLVPVVFWTEPQ